MKKIKILHLITRFIKGGADENTLLSILGLKDKYDITLGFGCEYDINMINKLENKGIKIKVFSLKHNSVISSLRSIFEISFYLKKETSTIASSFLLARLIPRKSNRQFLPLAGNLFLI